MSRFRAVRLKNWQSSALRVDKQHLLLPHHISFHIFRHVNSMLAVLMDGSTVASLNPMVIILPPNL
jgi:hypothetical protein